MTEVTKALRLYARERERERESLQLQNRRDNLTDLFGDDCVEITEAAGGEGCGEIPSDLTRVAERGVTHAVLIREVLERYVIDVTR